MELLKTEMIDGCSPPVLAVKGEIDMATSGQLRTALAQAISVDPHVVVDMAGVAFIDVMGLRVVLEAADKLNGDGPLKIFNAPLVERLLAAVGLDDVTSIEVRDGGPEYDG